MDVLKYLAVALFLPMAAAQAAPLIEGGVTPLAPGVLYEYDETIAGVAGANTFNFGLIPLVGLGKALSTNISLTAGGVTFGNFTITGPGRIFDHTVLTTADDGFIAEIQDIPFVIGALHNLNLTFSLANAAETLVNVQLSAVPLPAAGLLLIGAIGGLGALARRRWLSA